MLVTSFIQDYLSAYCFHGRFTEGIVHNLVQFVILVTVEDDRMVQCRYLQMKNLTQLWQCSVTVGERYQSPVQIGFDIKVPAIKVWNPAKVSYHVFFKEYSRKWFIWFLRSFGHRTEISLCNKSSSSSSSIVTTYCSTHLASHALPLAKSSDHYHLLFSSLTKLNLRLTYYFCAIL